MLPFLTSKVYLINVKDEGRWCETQKKINLNKNSARNKQKRGYLLILSFKIYGFFFAKENSRCKKLAEQEWLVKK